jgi:hypothetical protein
MDLRTFTQSATFAADNERRRPKWLWWTAYRHHGFEMTTERPSWPKLADAKSFLRKWR